MSLAPEITAARPEVAQTSRWDSAVIYQIYPRSFQEARRPGQPWRGEGSLLGITERLDYLESLGVDAIWLTPFYKSPMVDGGYDISDHKAVDPRYGSLADFDHLLAEAHKRGLMVMLDFVPNHVSDQHHWFQDVLKHGTKSDYYKYFFIRPGEPADAPPNNWASAFSADRLKAWQAGEFDLKPGQPVPYNSFWSYNQRLCSWVGHDFAIQQPSLDWSNPAVRQAQTDVLRFWLHRGVDGFRVDVINHTAKDTRLISDPRRPSYDRTTDNPADQLRRTHSANYRPALKQYLSEITGVMHEPEFAARDLHIVFEAYADDDVIELINSADTRANAFNFARMMAPWQAAIQRRLLSKYYGQLPPGTTANNVNGNHDQPRLASRLGADAARAATLLSLTLPGQSYIFNGDEAGLPNVDVPMELRDDKLDFRDGARTPMPWTGQANAGFSRAETTKLWLPLDPNYQQRNISTELRNMRSSLWLTKALTELRQSYPSLMSHGQPYILPTNNPDVFALAIRDDHEQIIDIINCSHTAESVRIGRAEQFLGRLLVSSHDNQVSTGHRLDLDYPIKLRPHEGVVIGA